MSAEKTMRRRVIRALKPLHAIAVENGCGMGTPDVNLSTGAWIELKSIDAWPARPETPLRIEHFSQEQRIWLLQRSKAGGEAWLLLKVADDWLLFDGEMAAALVGEDEGTQQMLKDNCNTLWEGGLDEKELLEILR